MCSLTGFSKRWRKKFGFRHLVRCNTDGGGGDFMCSVCVVRKVCVY